MTHRTRASLVAALALAATSAVHAEIKLNALFTDHMVLQRGQSDPVWGTAAPGKTLYAAVDGRPAAEARVGDDGKFTIKLPPLDEGAAHTIQITGDGATITLDDVLAGDVWVCSGQSNMGFNVNSTLNRDFEIASADHPTLRLFTVPNVGQANPVDDIVAPPWTATTSKSIPNFSAVAYFFGRKLNHDLNVPIGLIHTSWGGTPAEAWTPFEKLEALTDLREVQRVVDRRKNASTPDGKVKLAEAQKQYETDWRDWLKKTGRFDEGVPAKSEHWSSEDLDDSAWKTMNVPGNWVAEGEKNGCIWFRKTIDVPAEAAGQAVTLNLGMVDDNDITFFNGQEVGKIDQTQAMAWNMPRTYKVPGNLVKAGKNLIAVRVFDTGGAAGIMGPQVNALIGETKVSLAGAWKAMRESTFDEAAAAGTPMPQMPDSGMQLDHPNAPSSLYNGMIHPLGKFGIMGAIWYQGESNAGRYQEYEKLLTAMIGSWREQFGQGDFPFYIVGLANFTAATDDPNKFSDWAGLRDAQKATAEHVKNSAMSVTIDVGDANDIHPKNKQAVGERLALLALHDTYGKKDLVSRGPTLKKASFDDDKVTLSFDNIGGGLKSVGDKLDSFAIAGDDGKFVWADAKIDGETVVLTSPSVTKPTKVKYAFAQNPTASLYNAEGLPAEPFQAAK